MDPLLTVFTPTHVAHSSFHELPACIESFREKAIGAANYRHLIVCDSDPAMGSLTGEYLSLLKSIENKYPEVEVIHRPNSGCRKNYVYTLDAITTPYMFYLEHDWTFLEEINLPSLLSVFQDHPQVNYIRFNHKNNDSTSGWDTIHQEASEIDSLPLLKIDCWHNVIHMIRVDDFKTNKLPLVDSWSIEESLTMKYKRAIMECGFDEAHKEWGAYLYGKMDSKPVVNNIGVREGENSIGHIVLRRRDAPET